MSFTTRYYNHLYIESAVLLSLYVNVYLWISNMKGNDTGIIVYEYELRIGWGKSVSLPAQALPAPPPGQMAVRAKEVNSIRILTYIPLCMSSL